MGMGSFYSKECRSGSENQRPCKGVEDVGVLNIFFLSFQDAGGGQKELK